MSQGAPGEAVPIDKHHRTESFDCGSPALNEYLRRYALTNHQNRSARTYVAASGDRVAGYHTLAAGSVAPAEAPPRITKGLGRYPVPVILLARLAVDRGEQGAGLGKALLKDALLRVVQAAELIGCRALLVHAKDERAIAFYRKFGFEPSPIDEFHLFLLVKDLEKALASVPGWPA